MIRIFLSIILVILSAFIVFSYALPEYRTTEAHRATLAVLGDVLQKTKDVTDLTANLALSLNGITTGDMSKMDVILPGSVDEIRFVHMLSRVVSGGSVVLKGITIAETGRDPETPVSLVAPAVKKDTVRKIIINVSFAGSYDDLIRILGDMEKSLMIMDITNLSLAGDGKGGIYDYTITLQSYWSPAEK